jgi:hypothetical protein
MFETLDLTTFLIIYFVAFFFIIGIFIFKWFKDRDKIVVRVKSPGAEKVYLKKPELDGKTIIMEKAKGKNTGWHFIYDQIEIVKSGPMGLFRSRSVSVIYGAEKSISLLYEGKDKDAPCWDRRTEQKLFEAEVIKAAGKTGQKLEVPLILYLLIFGNLIIGLFTLAKMLGFVK